MKNDILKMAYSPEDFRKQGHLLIDQLADHFNSSINRESDKVIRWSPPEDEYAYWKAFLEDGDISDIFPKTIERSIHLHNPKYIGHQVCPPAPIASLSALISSSLNNGAAVYEMGMVPTAMERVITEFINSKIGYNESSRGFLTSGGTLANLTALLSARKAILDFDIWNEGHNQDIGIMVCEEAHYCIERAAKIMGLGTKGIIKIPATKGYNMDASLLDAYYKKALKEKITVFAVVGSAPSTATGMYDDLQALASFCSKHKLWLHVDGAHGGASIFSNKYKHTVKGIEHADSVVIDGHKMMMMPTITTALLYKNGQYSHTTFSQKADYLLEQSENEDWYNLAKRTFECTKTMMSLQWYTLLKTYGEAIFDENVTVLYDLGRYLSTLIKEHPDFELAIEPMSNIVCFRYIKESKDTLELNRLNTSIRQKLLEKGEYYIVQTKLRGIHFLRTTIMNPFTSKKDLNGLLEKIKDTAENIRM